MNKTLVLLLLLLGLCLTGLLWAQSNDEDQQLMRQYKLPEQAIQESTLAAKDSLMLLQGKPFSGTAYSRYANGQLQNATQYVDGMKQGTQLVWYPDGRPQLLSNYRHDRLNGHFKGWYQFGAVIYDLYLKDNSYAGDDHADEGTGQDTSGTEDNTPSADGLDQSNE